MKRTERIAIALTKEEKAEIRYNASILHISMSAYLRMKAFAKPVQGYTYRETPLPRLKRPPLPPKINTVKGLMIRELKDVLSQGIEVRFKKYDHKPPVDLEERSLLARQRMSIEEDLADEVGIK